MLPVEKFLNRLQSKKRALDLTEKLLEFVKVEAKQDFLEVGCGNGLVTKYLAQEYNASVIGIDVDPQQIELACKDVDSIENLRYLESDAADLPFKESSFDVVLSFGVLHHIKNWLDALKEVKRVLKPGGYFVYADIVYPERVTRMDGSSNVSFGLVTIDIDQLNTFLEKFGFTTIHSQWQKRLVCRNYEAVYRLN
ncbi:class I SAM-dependent methyltransferase [Chloroflexota bacterium]